MRVCDSILVTNLIRIQFSQEFAEDYDNFEKQVFDLDRRLGSILCQGFDDCAGLESVFKVRHSLI